MLRSFYLGLGFLILLPSTAFSTTQTPLFATSTEESLPSASPPSVELLAALLASVDETDRSILADCLTTDNKPASADVQYFETIMLPQLRADERVHFVRPALTPRCLAFYGAHLFRYWLIVEKTGPNGPVYSVRYAGSADNAAILPSVSHKAHDIKETNCTAVDCFTAHLRFDGKRYTPFRCSTVSFTSDKPNERTITSSQ